MTAPVDDVPDSLHSPVFVAQPTVVAAKSARLFGFALPWDRLPAARRTLLGWTLAFALLIALPFVDSNGGDLDGFAGGKDRAVDAAIGRWATLAVVAGLFSPKPQVCYPVRYPISLNYKPPW